MSSHGQVAMRERRRKESHPESFCAERSCLWRTSSGPCPKHGASILENAPTTIDLMQRLEASLAKSARAQTQVVAETLQADGDLGKESDDDRPMLGFRDANDQPELQAAIRERDQTTEDTLGEESASESIRNALQVLRGGQMHEVDLYDGLEKPDRHGFREKRYRMATVWELDVAAVERLLQKAVAQLEHEGRAF